jgi:hypothetical protein
VATKAKLKIKLTGQDAKDVMQQYAPMVQPKIEAQVKKIHAPRVKNSGY